MTKSNGHQTLSPSDSTAPIVRSPSAPNDYIPTEVKLQKQLGLLDGIAVIVGIIIGSGIFVSPIGVLQYSGSVGQALIIWVLSGVLSLLGALCYAELGTMIPLSGGDYAYINRAFGPLPGFLYLWVALLVIVPTGNAISALTFAQYILQPFSCQPPYLAVRLLAGVVTCFLTAINCYDVKCVTRVQDLFTGTKIASLGVIVLAGFYYLSDGHTENLKGVMDGTTLEPGYVALAFYSGLFSYSGWNSLNFVTEELKDPYKNLPRAICISLPLVTVIYFVTNLAYFIALSRDEMLASQAVAVTFGDRTLGFFAFCIPIFVACSTFGSLNGSIFSSSRLFFVGARQGHLPSAIGLIDAKRLTPVPSLIFLCLVTLVLLLIDDIYSLITYTSFVEALFTMMSVCGLLYLRVTEPNAARPIKVNMCIPILFFVVCAFLVCVPCYVSPLETGVGVAIILAGIVVYNLTIRWQNPYMLAVSKWLNDFCVKFFVCVPESSVEGPK